MRRSRYSLKGFAYVYNRDSKEFNSGAMRNWPFALRPSHDDTQDQARRKHNERMKMAKKETASAIRPLEQTKRHAFV